MIRLSIFIEWWVESGGTLQEEKKEVLRLFLSHRALQGRTARAGGTGKVSSASCLPVSFVLSSSSSSPASSCVPPSARPLTMVSTGAPVFAGDWAALSQVSQGGGCASQRVRDMSSVFPDVFVCVAAVLLCAIFLLVFEVLLLFCLNPLPFALLHRYSVPKEKIANIQSQLERLMEKNYYLYQSARWGGQHFVCHECANLYSLSEAYRGYVLSYQSHKLKVRVPLVLWASVHAISSQGVLRCVQARLAARCEELWFHRCFDACPNTVSADAMTAAPPKINLGVRPNPETGGVLVGNKSSSTGAFWLLWVVPARAVCFVFFVLLIVALLQRRVNGDVANLTARWVVLLRLHVRSVIDCSSLVWW
jgi:hypothetical protein